MNVIRVRENVRYERAKSETDHVAIGAQILDEERDLPAALEIERAPSSGTPAGPGARRLRDVTVQ
jgi:hypothetical protein